jgi:hypothetical protein
MSEKHAAADITPAAKGSAAFNYVGVGCCAKMPSAPTPTGKKAPDEALPDRGSDQRLSFAFAILAASEISSAPPVSSSLILPDPGPAPRFAPVTGL